MKKAYYTIELILFTSLIFFGEKVGTHNIWLCVSVILASHLTISLLFKFYLKDKTDKAERTRKKQQKTDKLIKDVRRNTNIDISC